MSEYNLNENALATKNNIVRVRVPASVAFDLDSMNKVTAEVLKELGCRACHSGHDIRFDIEREFIFNAKLDMINRF